MLVYCFGSLYYVAAVVWLTAACVLVSVPALTKLSWDLTSLDSAMPPEVRAAVMLAADHVLAGILVSGAMWQLLSYSFAPGYLPGRPRRARPPPPPPRPSPRARCGAVCGTDRSRPCGPPRRPSRVRTAVAWFTGPE